MIHCSLIIGGSLQRSYYRLIEALVSQIVYFMNKLHLTYTLIWKLDFIFFMIIFFFFFYNFSWKWGFSLKNLSYSFYGNKFYYHINLQIFYEYKMYRNFLFIYKFLYHKLTAVNNFSFYPNYVGNICMYLYLHQNVLSIFTSWFDYTQVYYWTNKTHFLI
jgi:hypothetical protein